MAIRLKIRLWAKLESICAKLESICANKVRKHKKQFKSVHKYCLNFVRVIFSCGDNSLEIWRENLTMPECNGLAREKYFLRNVSSMSVSMSRKLTLNPFGWPLNKILKEGGFDNG
jgi:hypothetical protein